MSSMWSTPAVASNGVDAAGLGGWGGGDATSSGWDFGGGGGFGDGGFGGGDFGGGDF